jgi:3'(2'), 5'-bisphosphate nucleotidase
VDVAGLWDELEDSLTPVLGWYRSRVRELSVQRKPDRTLVSEADIATQEHLISRILAIDPSATILAEENTALAPWHDARLYHRGSVWIIDPIDGTSEFVRPDRFEYCCVVCLLEGLRPVAAFILAPEIGVGHGRVCVRMAGDGHPIEVNGETTSAVTTVARRASVTRSSVAPRPWEQRLRDAGYELKTRTTSQTLDMVRTCVDLSGCTEPSLPPFGLFYREDQKVWDGAAGMCLARAAGLRVTDRHGREREVVDAPLGEDEPRFDSTLVAASWVTEGLLTGLAEG